MNKCRTGVPQVYTIVLKKSLRMFIREAIHMIAWSIDENLCSTRPKSGLRVHSSNDSSSISYCPISTLRGIEP